MPLRMSESEYLALQSKVRSRTALAERPLTSAEIFIMRDLMYQTTPSGLRYADFGHKALISPATGDIYVVEGRPTPEQIDEHHQRRSIKNAI